MRHSYFRVAIGLLLGLWLGMMTLTQAGAAPPAVRGVLFWSNLCSHCHYVIDKVLPPLQAKYGAGLDIMLVEVSTPQNQARFVQTLTALNIPSEQRGVPFRFEVGPKDVEGGSIMVKRRLDRGKEIVKLGEINAKWLRGKLAEVHRLMFDKAKKFRDENIRDAASMDEMKQILAEKGGFVRCFFKQDKEAEAAIKETTKATVRCIPSETAEKRGKCIVSGEEGQQVLFAVAY